MWKMAKTFEVPAVVNGADEVIRVSYDSDGTVTLDLPTDQMQFSIDSLRQIVQQYDDNQEYGSKIPDPNDA
jgi:hypothetical protein